MPLLSIAPEIRQLLGGWYITGIPTDQPDRVLLLAGPFLTAREGEALFPATVSLYHLQYGQQLALDNLGLMRFPDESQAGILNAQVGLTPAGAPLDLDAMLPVFHDLRQRAPVAWNPDWPDQDAYAQSSAAALNAAIARVTMRWPNFSLFLDTYLRGANPTLDGDLDLLLASGLGVAPTVLQLLFRLRVLRHAVAPSPASEEDSPHENG